MADKRKVKKRKEESGAEKECEKASKEEYAVAKWLRKNVPTKKTKFLSHHVEYFTGAKAVDALLISQWATSKSPLFTTRHDVIRFLNDMLVHKFFHRAKKVPVTEQELKVRKKKDGDKEKKDNDSKEEKDVKDGEKSQTSACEGKDTKDSKEKEKEKRKRKIRLDMHNEQVFLDTPDAYVWIYDPIPAHYWLAGLAVMLGSIGICMFPLWPPTVRKGVYYLSIAGAGFLVLIILLAILRLVVFCAVWVLTLSRHHLWLLPNLVEDVGFFESFWPLYHYEYRGPSATPPTKPKKKKKKEKNSDDEAEETAPVTAKAEEETALKQRKAAEPQKERGSESDSEPSQRSSDARDFEMVETGDVDTA